MKLGLLSHEGGGRWLEVAVATGKGRKATGNSEVAVAVGCSSSASGSMNLW